MDLAAVSKDGDVTKKLYVDEEGNAVIEKIQTHDDWMARNRVIRDGQLGLAGMRHIGFIPDCVVDQLKKEGIDIYCKEDMPKVIAKLSSSEFWALRTTEGAI